MRWFAFFKPATLLFLAIWLVLMIGGRSRFFQDPGTFWHTTVGQQILSKGFTDTDTFTFTFAGKTWIPHQWLGEVLMALAHAVDGFDTLLLATSTILAVLFTWLGVRLMRCGLHPSLAFVLVAIAVAASSGHFHVRPHLATIAGFAIVMAFLCDFEARRITRARLTWLIPIFWIWSNIHGGALGGMVTFGLAILGWTIAWKLGWESPLSTYRDVLMLGLIFLGGVATAFINPYSWRLPEAWLGIYQMQSLPRLIKEHSSIDLADRNAWMILLFGAIYFGLLASTLPGKPRVVWWLPAIWFVLACMRIRHAPLFAVGALIAIADFFPRTRLARKWEASGSDLFETPRAHAEPVSPTKKLAAYALPMGVVLLTLGLQATHVPVPVMGHTWARLDPQVWPTELLDDLKAHQYDRPGGTRIFNEYAFGGFLIYHAPGYRVFVDDRCELFGDAWLSEFLDKPYLIADWEERYGPFDYALIRNQPDSGFAVYFQTMPEWELFKQKETATLYRRRSNSRRRALARSAVLRCPIFLRAESL